MFGSDIGNLSVNQWFTDAAKSPVTYVTISGAKGDVWRFYTAGPLDMASGNYKMEFRATHGSGFNGDISIDHITFTPGCHDS